MKLMKVKTKLIESEMQEEHLPNPFVALAWSLRFSAQLSKILVPNSIHFEESFLPVEFPGPWKAPFGVALAFAAGVSASRLQFRLKVRFGSRYESCCQSQSSWQPLRCGSAASIS